jgi:hypothetical protein
MERPYAAKTAAECLAIAEQNERFGKRSGSTENRDMFRRIAATWRQLARLGHTEPPSKHGWR